MNVNSRLHLDFISFSINIYFFLFQDPIQDPTWHLVIKFPSLLVCDSFLVFAYFS